MIKVMTGIRRCGKSSLMKLMAEHLRENGIADEQIIEMNFESMSIPEMDARGFHEYVKARICPDKRTYLFFDEVQKVPGWENAVNSFRVDFDCDIYITGSNAYLLSSELSTYLSGRYVEIRILPLSFREFLDFHGYTLTEYQSPAGRRRKRVTDEQGEAYDLRELFDAYITFGGMPMLSDIGLELERVTAALDGVYSAAVVNDILEREKRKGQRTITDAVLLRKIIMFLADNIGNNASATSIGNTLVSEGLLEVDFIAIKTGEKKYIQVTESMSAPETRERELAPLRRIRDNYDKIVLVLDGSSGQTQDGIRVINALDFLLDVQ